jgi:hypothetical protein
LPSRRVHGHCAGAAASLREREHGPTPSDHAPSRGAHDLYSHASALCAIVHGVIARSQPGIVDFPLEAHCAPRRRGCPPAVARSLWRPGPGWGNNGRRGGQPWTSMPDWTCTDCIVPVNFFFMRPSALRHAPRRSGRALRGRSRLRESRRCGPWRVSRRSP